MDGREVVSKFSQEVPNQLEEEQVGRNAQKIIRDQLQEKQVGKQLDNVTNDNQKFYVSDSLLLFDADLDLNRVQNIG